jgi:hypothetical protein
MEDLKKIQEFFSKPLEENTFKVGQKVTYLGHPAVVIATKEYNGKNYVSVSYDKGKGKTKASDILTTDGSIDQAIAENKLLKQAKLSSAEYQKAKKLKDFNPNDYEWDPSESLYVKEKKSKFKKHGEMSGFDMRGIDEASEASKFKKGDKITYYGNKGVVNSAKYNTFAKDWDYTISYIEDGTRKGESGVRDKELKSSPINEAKFTDYSNNELAAYAKELSKQRADAASKGQNDLVSGINKEIEAATRELKKRSQKLKDLSRTDVKEPVGEEVKGVPVEKTPATITRKEWDKTPKNDKAIINGIAYVKRYDRVIGTYMAPIKIVNEEENLDENFAKFDILKMAVTQHEKGVPYYDKTRLINIFNQLSSSDQVKAKKQYSGYFEESLDEAFGEDYYIRVRLKDAPEAMKAFDDFIGKNDFRLNKGGDQFSTDDVKAGIRLYRHLTDRLIKVYDHNLPLEDKYLPVYEGGKWGYQEAAKNMIKFLQTQLDDMGVEYEMSKTDKVRPFKVIYKPINKSDDWYAKFEDLIDRANLGSVVKTSMKEGELNEAYVPSNIAEFAKRKGVSSLVKTVAGWAEKVGKRIMGGTAIGKNYDTLILDMTFQGSEIRINTEYETVELYDEPVRTFAQFKRVYEENQEENLDEATNDSRIDNPKFGPAPKQFADLRAKLGDESLLDKIQMINVNTLRELLDELDSYNLEEIEDDKFKNDPWKGGPEYKKEDLLAQKIFGIKYFNWLSDWEQFHLVNKYNLDKNIITKENKDSTYNEYSEVGYKKVGEAKGVAQNIREEQEDKIDIVTMDVPLFIRALEYAKEDAQEDMDLHDFAERAIAATKEQGILQMDDYDMLVGDKEPMNEVEIGDKVKINKEYGGGKGKVTNKIGSFIVVNGKSYHESDVEESGMNEETGYSQYLKDDPEFPGGKTKGLTPDVMNKILMRVVQDIEESRPGLWDNIRAKRERGEKPSRKGSKAYKTAVKAGKEINKAKD